MRLRQIQTGFTIVELVIVIAVIAILASVTVIAYNSTKNTSNATIIANDIKTLEKGMKSAAADEQRTTWPVDSSGSPYTSNPLVVDIVSSANSNLGDYFNGFSSVTIANVGQVSGKPNIIYDNDNDTVPACGSNISADYRGTNLIFYNFSSTALAQAVDDALDDSNLLCGRFTLNGTTARYILSSSPTIN